MRRSEGWELQWLREFNILKCKPDAPLSLPVGRKLYVTFSGAAYDRTTEQIAREGTRLGADSVQIYDDRWLMGTEFWQRPEVQYLWNHRGVGNPDSGRGFGWFSWKPLVMHDALSRVNDGDIVLFTDADTYPIADFSMLYDECARIGGTMLFAASGCNHARWCKRDCFIRMGMDEPRWRNVQHAVARFFLFQEGADGVDNFLAEWQHYCLDRLCQTFDPSELAPEHPEFQEHRCEQAILTNLAHKYGHKLYREACQYGDSWPEDRGLMPETLFHQDGATTAKTLEGSRFRNVPELR